MAPRSKVDLLYQKSEEKASCQESPMGIDEARTPDEEKGMTRVQWKAYCNCVVGILGTLAAMILSLWVLYSCNVLERQAIWQGGYFRHQPDLEINGLFAFWDSDQCSSYDNPGYFVWATILPDQASTQLEWARWWAFLAPVAGSLACFWWMIFWGLQFYGDRRRQAQQVAKDTVHHSDNREGVQFLRRCKLFVTCLWSRTWWWIPLVLALLSVGSQLVALLLLGSISYCQKEDIQTGNEDDDDYVGPTHIWGFCQLGTGGILAIVATSLYLVGGLASVLTLRYFFQSQRQRSPAKKQHEDDGVDPSEVALAAIGTASMEDDDDTISPPPPPPLPMEEASTNTSNIDKIFGLSEDTPEPGHLVDDDVEQQAFSIKVQHEEHSMDLAYTVVMAAESVLMEGENDDDSIDVLPPPPPPPLSSTESVISFRPDQTVESTGNSSVMQKSSEIFSVGSEERKDLSKEQTSLPAMFMEKQSLEDDSNNGELPPPPPPPHSSSDSSNVVTQPHSSSDSSNVVSQDGPLETSEDSSSLSQASDVERFMLEEIRDGSKQHTSLETEEAQGHQVGPSESAIIIGSPSIDDDEEGDDYDGDDNDGGDDDAMDALPTPPPLSSNSSESAKVSDEDFLLQPKADEDGDKFEAPPSPPPPPPPPTLMPPQAPALPFLAPLHPENIFDDEAPSQDYQRVGEGQSEKDRHVSFLDQDSSIADDSGHLSS